MVNQLDPGLAESVEEAADPLAILRLIDITAQLSAEAELSLRGTVTAARTAGLSWEQIGDTLHVSRQAAQQRFGTKVASNSAPEFWRLQPVTVFTEMQTLNEAGRYGWRSVGFGASFHDLVRTDVQWVHRRVSVLSPRHSLEDRGWQRIDGTWFPWAYYSQPLEARALPGGAFGLHAQSA